MKDTDWEILYELHKNPNLTKVANLLFITQPSLTKRLQAIEGEFNITIVDRTPKGLRFTREGEYLAERAQIYMDFIRETKAGLKTFIESSEERILIGASYTYSKYTLSDLMMEYRRRHPQVEFEVVNEQSNLLFRRVLEGSVDVAFIRGDYEGPVRQVLMGESQGYAVTREPVKLEELPGLPMICYKTNDRTRELLEDWWRDYFQCGMPGGMAVGYVDVAWQLIHKGLGYTCCFLPENFRNEYGLCLTPLKKRDGTPVVRRTWFVYPKEKRIPGALEQFIRYTEEMAGKLP